MKNKFKNRYVFFISSFLTIIILISPIIIFLEFLKIKRIKKDLKKNLVSFQKKESKVN
jgi:hypothetical protein